MGSGAGRVSAEPGGSHSLSKGSSKSISKVIANFSFPPKLLLYRLQLGDLTPPPLLPTSEHVNLTLIIPLLSFP